MTPIKSAHAAGTAERQRIIGTLERTDTTKFTAWRDELQWRTRGTYLHHVASRLPVGAAYGLLLWLANTK